MTVAAVAPLRSASCASPPRVFSRQVSTSFTFKGSQLPLLCAGVASLRGLCGGGEKRRPARRCIARRCNAVAVLEVSPDEAQKLVPGLRLFPDFLSEEEGEALASYLDHSPPAWRKEQFGVPTLYNVKHFGVLGSLRPRMVRLPDPSKGEVDLPEDGILGEVAARLGKKGKPWSSCLKSFKPNEANVNDYRRSESSQLLMHWDDRGLYEEAVCSVSVLGECIMTFQPTGRSNFRSSEGDAEAEGGRAVRLVVPARSLLLLKGAARYEWQHGIPEADDLLTERRVAIIFRRVRGVVPSAGLSEGKPSRPAIPQRAMVISTNWPDPDVSAAGRVTSLRLQMLRGWLGDEAALTFASPARPGNSQGKLSETHDLTCIRIKTNDHSSVLSALEAAGNPELVIFDGFNAEERFGHYVREALPNSMRVLDMQDFHALRLGRERLIAAGATADVATFLPSAEDEDLQRELAALQRCDAILAISRHEERLLVETYGLPRWKVCAAPFGFSGNADGAVSPGFGARQGAMFIGNWRHRPNRDAAKWLIQEVWPLVRKDLPDALLNVYGANQTPEDAALHDSSIGAQVQGYCRSVPAAMQRHLLLVAPLRYGAGVKGKVLEALQHGLVVVTTAVGIEGIASAESFPGYVATAQDPAEFASVVVQALQDQQRWEVTQKEGLSLMARDFDEIEVRRKLREFLQARWSNLLEDRKRDYVGQMLWHSSLRSTELMAKYLAAKEDSRRWKALSQRGNA